MNSVINATVISNFAAAGGLNVLRDTIRSLWLPLEVYDEIRAGQLVGYAFYDGIERHISPFTSDGWMQLTSMTAEELPLLATLPKSLHSGEAACLCIARQRNLGLLTDDLAARRQARKWNISISGTLGVLLLAIQDGRLTLASGNAVLHAMQLHANYRSLTDDLADLLP